MDSSNVSEDGASERVRFDNTVYYSINNKVAIEKVCFCQTLPLNQTKSQCLISLYFVFNSMN